SDGTNFLVVWRERSVVAPASKIHARQISGSGTLGTVQTPFSTTSSIYDYPTVTFGGAGYAIAWKEAVNGYTIRFLRLTAAGAAIFVPLAVANDASSSAFQYAHLEAQTGSAYLLTWNGQGTSGYDIFGRAISKTGSLVGNPLTISSAPQSQYRSRSSFNGTDFLVTWYDYRSGSSNCEIYGQRVTTTGALVGTSAAGNVAVSLGVNSQRYPDPVWCGGRYSVFFQDYRYNNNPTLFRQKISGSGKLIDADAHANEIVYANSNRVDYPIRAVCAGQKIFVVWREGNTLHGTLVAP
ncbi:MAG: hypothetical protein KAI47_02875, partial [Deltaproteobacteria bacterium]|nr:hypothetical protein [Deltaproteobacteria bacterium]